MTSSTSSLPVLGQALLVALALAGAGSGLQAETRYYVNDHLATTVGISDAAGEIAALEADAFGSPLAAGDAPSRYTGKPYDEDMGAFVFPFRNYRAEEGRWMTSDPSGFPDGVNSYSYVDHIFLQVDDLGLASITVYAYGPSGSSSYGHAWTGVRTDDGVSSTVGHYPGGARDDSLTPHTHSHTFEVSDAAAQAARNAQNNAGTYRELLNNCVDLVESVLDAANISRPSFSTWGVSDPVNVVNWINTLNNRE